MHVLTAKWIPPNERSKFVTAYLGSSVGIALFYPLFGYMMHWASWEWVYHVCGMLGTLWWLGWVIFVYDSPSEHPRISETELRYIEKSLGSSVQTTDAQMQGTPWQAILTSRPVWMNVIAQWGGIWGLFTLMTQAPTYFRVVHNWNIRAVRTNEIQFVSVFVNILYFQLDGCIIGSTTSDAHALCLWIFTICRLSIEIK